MNKIIALFKRNWVKFVSVFVTFGTIIGMMSGNSFTDSLCNSALAVAAFVIAVNITLIAHYSGCKIFNK